MIRYCKDLGMAVSVEFKPVEIYSESLWVVNSRSSLRILIPLQKVSPPVFWKGPEYVCAAHKPIKAFSTSLGQFWG